MPDNYSVTLRIVVSRGEPQNLVVAEETTFANLSFAKMTHISAEFYEQIAKLEKEKK